MSDIKFKEVDYFVFAHAYLTNWRECKMVRDNCHRPDSFGWHSKGNKYYMHSDYKSGFCITKEGELVLLHSTIKGRGRALVSLAVYHGALSLDCFEGYLPSLYREFGFVEYKREPNWIDGGPAVVYMQKWGR